MSLACVDWYSQVGTRHGRHHQSLLSPVLGSDQRVVCGRLSKLLRRPGLKAARSNLRAAFRVSLWGRPAGAIRTALERPLKATAGIADDIQGPLPFATPIALKDGCA